METEQKKSNIVLITIDCLRYDKCGFNGYSVNTTPNLDSLAAENWVFEEAYASGSRTAESVPGFLSGRLSYECDYVNELSYKAIPENAETIASWLKQHGYNTKAALSNPQLSPVRNFDKGFDCFSNIRIQKRGDKFAKQDEDANQGGSPFRSIKKKISTIDYLPVDPVRIGYTSLRLKQLRNDWATVDGQEVISSAIDSLDPCSEKPQFLWTHLNDLHSPLHPKRVQKGELLTENKYRLLYGDSKRIKHQKAPIYERMYDSMLHYVDDQIGRLLAFLDKNDMMEETVVVVTSDHGEAMFERGIYGHAAGAEQRLYYDDRDYLHNELLHVPLLVSIPNMSSKRIYSTFSLLWVHELLSQIINLPIGDLPQKGDLRIYEDHIDVNGPILSDTLTEKGHTVTTRNKEGTFYISINGNKNINNGWYYEYNDRMERFKRGEENTPDDLLAAWEKMKAHPDSIQSLNDSIDSQTLDLLSDLGYK